MVEQREFILKMTGLLKKKELIEAVKIILHTMPMMVFYFGIKLTVILTIYMVLFSVFNGYLVELLLSVNKRRRKK